MGRHPQIRSETAPLYESYLVWVNAFGSFFKSPLASPGHLRADDVRRFRFDLPRLLVLAGTPVGPRATT